MVEKAIEQYVKAGGKAPYGLAYAWGSITDGAVPANLIHAQVPGFKDGTFAIVPLQTLVELTHAALWITEDEDDE
jgi:hypothetical protein